jgi:hypothetical protein
MTVITSTQGTEIKRTAVQGQPGEKVTNLSQKVCLVEESIIPNYWPQENHETPS